MTLDSFQKEIAAAATIENLVPDDGTQWTSAREIWLTCPNTNAGDMLLGSKDRQLWPIAPGSTQRISSIMKPGQSLRQVLSEIWVKADTNNDVVIVMLIDPSTK